MAMREITTADFETLVEKSTKPVFIDFWASWCGPCRQYMPIVEEVSGEIGDVEFFKCNVETEAELARRFGISSIPTSMLFKDGVPVLNHTGAMPKKSLVELINEYK